MTFYAPPRFKFWKPSSGKQFLIVHRSLPKDKKIIPCTSSWLIALFLGSLIAEEGVVYTPRTKFIIGGVDLWFMLSSVLVFEKINKVPVRWASLGVLR